MHFIDVCLNQIMVLIYIYIYILLKISLHKKDTICKSHWDLLQSFLIIYTCAGYGHLNSLIRILIKMDIPMLQLRLKNAKMWKGYKVKVMSTHNHPSDSIQYVGFLVQF